MKSVVKGFPNIECEQYQWGIISSEYEQRPSRRVGYLDLSGFRSWDTWTYTFYDTRTGKKIGVEKVEVDHRNGYHQDPPPPHKIYKRLLPKLAEQMTILSQALQT